MSIDNPFLKKIQSNLDAMRSVTAKPPTTADALHHRSAEAAPDGPIIPEELSELQKRIKDEVEKSITHTFESLTGKTPEERAEFLRELEKEFSGILDERRATGATDDDIRLDFDEFQTHASESDKLASLAAAGNTYAQMARSKFADSIRHDIGERAMKMAELEATKKFGMLANMRRFPGLSLLEFGGRTGIEGFIAYVAYQSAQNAVFLWLSQTAATGGMSGGTRRAIAEGVAAIASYSAFKFRHSIYASAQDWGADGKSALKTITSPKKIAKTGFRAGMAGLVAFGGAIAITKTINISEKMSGFGAQSQEKIQPVSDSLARGADIMAGFFTDLQAKQDAIVNTETGAAAGTKGTGRSAGRGYKIKAAHKDYLFNGRYDRVQYPQDLDPALTVFRKETLQIPEGITVADYIRQLWEKSGFEAQRETAKREIDVLSGLLKTEKEQSFETRLVKTTLKQVDDPTVIPHQVQRVLGEIQKLLTIHHDFKTKVDDIFAKINAQGLGLAKAAGEGIDVHAPDFTIDIAPLGELPSAPGMGEHAITISPEDVKHIVEFFEKQPGLAWFGEFVKDDDPSRSRTKIILSFMALYFGIENTANLLFAMRELARRRREKKEMPEKIRDIYVLEDKIATEMAFTVLQHSPLYAGVLKNEPDRILPIVEQLKGRIRFFLRSKADEVDPRLPEDPTWAQRQWHRIDHISNILIDRGPERIRHVDRYISELEEIIDRSKTPEGFVALLAECQLPGTEDIARVYDPKLLAIAVGSIDAREANRQLEEHIQFLIARVQARTYVVDRLRTDLISRADTGMDAMERAAKFWSGGVMLQLDGTGDVSVGTDDARFFETYARLSQEEAEDEQELRRLVQSGRTMMMRALVADPVSQRVTVPAMLQESFLEDALKKPLSVSQAMTDAYQREIKEYMQDDTAGIVSRQLSAINTQAVPAILSALKTQPYAQDYLLRAEYAYSPEKRGPVFRIGIHDPDTNVRVGTAEYHTTIPQRDAGGDIAASVREWYAPSNPGALEVSARILHAHLKTNVERLAEMASHDPALGTDLKLTLSGRDTVSKVTLDILTRVMTASTILERQMMKLASIKTHPMSGQQLGIFQIPDAMFDDANTPLDAFLDAAPVHAEGISEIGRAIPEIRSLFPDHDVVLDVVRRKVVITTGRSLSERRFRTRTIELDMASLYDIAGMKRQVDKELSGEA